MKIIVNVKKQELQYWNNDQLECSYSISTAKNGVGEEQGSECTPRGQHIVRAKIGNGAAINSIFVGRRFTSEIFNEDIRKKFPERDWILTRILWLSGTELGVNRLGNVDTMQRYIYIHGCPDKDVMGQPSSHGCIKMRNSELVELFDKVDVGTLVTIKEG